MTDWYSVRKIADSYVLVEMKNTSANDEFTTTEEITYLQDGDCLEFKFMDGKLEKHHIFMENNRPKIFILYNKTYIPIAISDLPYGVLMRFTKFANTE